MRFNITLTVICMVFLFASCKNSSNKNNTDGQGSNLSGRTSKNSIFTNSDRLTYYSEPDTSIVTGRLVIKNFFGPPGFGDTPEIDDHYSVYFLMLSSMITILPKDTIEREIDSVKEIQLEYSEKGTNDDTLKRYVNRIVRIKGLLEGPDGSPAQYTKAIMETGLILNR